jgi:hypothetical protein
LDRERPLAEYLATRGNQVVALAEPANVNGVRNADALVDGVRTELKKLDGSVSKTIKNQVNKSKSGTGQAPNIIIDARGTGMTKEEALRGLKRALGGANEKVTKVTSIRVVGDGFDVSVHLLEDGSDVIVFHP